MAGLRWLRPSFDGLRMRMVEAAKAPDEHADALDAHADAHAQTLTNRARIGF